MGSCSKGLWGMSKKNLMPEEKGGKKSLSRAEINHPLLRTLETRSIHPPGTQGIACTAHSPLAALCLSLRTAGRQQRAPSKQVCLVLLLSNLSFPEQLNQQPQGKQRGRRQNSHKNPAGTAGGFAWVSALVWGAPSFLKGR